MKVGKKNYHADQDWTASKEKCSNPTNVKNGPRRTKNTMGPGTREERNERFGKEIVG